MPMPFFTDFLRAPRADRAWARVRLIQSHLPTAAELRADLEAGLLAPRASIAPKYFYDTLGSQLFAAITALDEYTPPRTEAAIFARHGAEIAAAVGPGTTLIDLGAGNCAKAARLFGALRPRQYVAVDISVDFLHSALECLQREHPDLEIVGIGQDFARGLELPREVTSAHRLFFYPGSSIGNFAPDEAIVFLRRLRGCGGEDAQLLIGVDLIKDEAVLNAAYDDALGVTAAFNRNVLRHVNRLLGADFDVAQWKHVAFYSARATRIEMHLEALADVTVRWPGGGRSFARGERIHTEYSYKYRPETFTAVLRAAGWTPRHVWLDDRAWFAVLHCRG
ncbi:MAG: L-histidine N(alpha)-methyltransferase [Burkholderiaceae bacterium]